MTSDYALLERPTESLVLPTKRRFFPFKIPNSHQQLRHYISTADPDRIYVVVDKVVYAIHIESRKRESIAVIPFVPKCLDAGYGWIGVGGSDNGECAFIRIADQSVRVQDDDVPASHPSEVDSALPIDLDPPSRTSSPWSAGEEPESARRASPRLLPEVQLYKFGGSIVNSVTIHRLPGDGKGLADEDVIIVGNNDKTVTIYSLTRGKVLKVLHHQACMNYAIMSPDSSLLAAVGDESCAYFYEVSRELNTAVFTENGQKLTGWHWNLIRHVDMDISTRFDDGCCFTIAFSPSSHLCAVGSQSGVITMFNVQIIRERPHGRYDKSPIICHFHSSRSYFDGGAVRCMMFSPMPWDLLVWIEDNGRAGIADVRQDFTRRQILNLDMKDPNLQEVRTEPILDDSEGLGFAFNQAFPESRDEMDAAQRAMLDSIEGSSNEQRGDGLDRSSLRESLMHDLTERERLIVEFLNTARWTSRMEEGLTDRGGRPNLHSHLPRSRFAGVTDSSIRPSRPTSPLRPNDPLHDLLRDSYVGHNADRRHSSTRRQSSVVLSQNNPENVEAQPSITVNWAASPAEIQPATLDNTLRTSVPSTGEPSGAQRSTSAPRRPERQETTSESRYEPPRFLNSELRANVAAERLRRQRQLINEAHNRNSLRDQRHRPQLLGFERSPRWIRNILNELPDRNYRVHRDRDPGGTAGLGWGSDGKTLYVGTVDGIFEFHLNVHDRKTFPVISFR